MSRLNIDTFEAVARQTVRHVVETGQLPEGATIADLEAEVDGLIETHKLTIADMSVTAAFALIESLLLYSDDPDAFTVVAQHSTQAEVVEALRLRRMIGAELLAQAKRRNELVDDLAESAHLAVRTAIAAGLSAAIGSAL